METTTTLVLRLFHILGGIFWVGSALVMAGFLIPAVQATGRNGAGVMQELMLRRKLRLWVAVAMVLNILSGLILYAMLTSATHGAWASSRPGITYGLGGLAAILGAGIGMTLSGTAARRMAVIGQQSSATGGPSPEQQAEMQRLQARMVLGSRLAAALLMLASAAMAVARYL